jgi:hypothetical protein
MTKRKKQRYPSAITPKNAKKLNETVEKNKYLNANRSGLVNLILNIFFKVNKDYEKLRG